jgi:hypothetical protein
MSVLLRLPLYIEPALALVPTPTPEPAEEDLTWPEGEEPVRPRTRGECEDAPRPCPWVSCKQHLFWEYLKHHPEATVETMKHSCVLDIADEGGMTLEDVGEIFGLTRERIRQLETDALRKLKKRPQLMQYRAE